MDIVQGQLELVKKHWPDLLNQDNKIESSNMMIHAIIKELSELSDGYACFPWSKSKEIDREYLLEEITDILHFVLELYIIWGVTNIEEVEELYFKKKK